jgi:hypothetical protein
MELPDCSIPPDHSPGREKGKHVLSINARRQKAECSVSKVTENCGYQNVLISLRKRKILFKAL